MNNDNDTNSKKYFLRSQVKNPKKQKNKQKKIKQKNKQKKIKQKKIKQKKIKQKKIKKVNKEENNKSNYVDKSVSNSLTDLILKNALSKLYKYDEFKQSDDEFYEDIPNEIIYLPHEESYLKSIDIKKRKKLIEEEKKLLLMSDNKIPMRFKILSSKSLNNDTKYSLLKKIEHFNTLEESDNEYSKLYQWIESLKKIPFDSYCKTKCTINNNAIEIINYLNNTKKILDNSIYGHESAKSKIIQIISQQITNPKCLGNCIAIQGPPGNGKTTLVKEGVCKAIGKPFTFIALGGAQNSEYMTGHDYTYEGAKCGRIIEILQECKCMNPVIYFDELDKISESPKGQEISNLLCHLTDTSQNSCFHDKYFSGINFDLSKALFIFSYNDENKINNILLDRMIKIKTNGFSNNDKLVIANDFLIPKSLANINFTKNDIIFNNENLNYILNNFTEKEKGVRNFKRCIETIISKINVIRLLNGYSKYKNTNLKKDIYRNYAKNVLNMDSEKNISKWVKKNIGKETSIIPNNIKINNIIDYNLPNFKIPITITNSIIEKFLKLNEAYTNNLMMYT